MSSANKTKSISKEFLKGASSIIAGAVGEYVSTAMPTASSVLSEVKADSSYVVSTLSNTPQAVAKKLRQFKTQFGIRNVSAWFKGAIAGYETNGESEGDQIGFDTPIDDATSEISTENSQIAEVQNVGNKVSKAIVESTMHAFEGQQALISNISTAIDTQTAAITTGFDSVNGTLNKILDVVTKNTAAIIETNIASSYREQSGAQNMLSSGRFSLKDYKSSILDNIDYSPLGIVKSMFPIVKDVFNDPIKFLNQTNPKELAKLGLAAGLNKFNPKLKNNMAIIDQSINNIIMSSLIRMGQDKSYGWSGQIKRLLGIRSDRDEFDSNSRSSLEVKAVPFDSITHEAITNAIPGYLRKILVAVGGEDVIYDYRGRTFRTKSAMKHEFRNTSASNGALRNASSDLQNVFGDDEFGNMMYDMMITKMGASGSWDDSLRKFETKNGFKKYMEEMLQMNGEITLNKKERKRIQQMNDRYEKLIALSGNPAKELNLQIALETANRNNSMQSYISQLDKYNIDVSEFSANADTDLLTILERNGRLTDKQRKEARQKLRNQSAGIHTNLGNTDDLVGVDYTNRALYEIFRRLNTGINVYQVGQSKSRHKPFEYFGDDYLKPPKSYKAKSIPGTQNVAGDNNSNIIKSILDDHGPNLLENQIDENGDIENLSASDRALRWVKSRGGAFSRALATGNSEQVTSALYGMLKDVGEIGSKTINKAFGNVTGFLKHKFTGAEYTYQDTDADGKPITVTVGKNNGEGKGGGILGYIDDRFRESFDSIKDKGSKWFKEVSQWFQFDDGKSSKKDGNVTSKRQKIIATSVGALAGGGILGGPIGLIMGGLAGSMLGSLNIGDKIKETLFGRDENDNPTGILSKLADNVIDPIKYQFQKTANAMATTFKKNILGPLSDLGQAIKDKITHSAETHFGKVFKTIGGLILTPFKGMGKLLLNIAKLPVNIIGGVTRGAAGITSGLFGMATESLAKSIAKKSTATHEVTELDKDGNPITKTLSAAEYLKYRRKNRNKEIAKSNEKFKDFKTWQQDERAKRLERRKLFKKYTSEEITQITAEGSKDTADNTSKILEQTEEQTKTLSDVNQSISHLEHEATHSDGTHSLQTHDQGIHDLLKQIIEIISSYSGNTEFAKKYIRRSKHVDDRHADIPGDKLPDMVSAASTITGSKNIVNQNSDDQAEEANSAKELANNMIGAVSSIASGDGNVSEDEADGINTVIDEASSSNPSKSKLKNALNKIFKKKEKNKAEEGDKKESFLSKLLNGAKNIFGGLFSGLSSGISGLFTQYILPIGAVLGVTGWLQNKGDGSILEGISVVSKEVKTWWSDHKDDVIEGITTVFKYGKEIFDKIAEPLITKVVLPLGPKLVELAVALVPALEKAVDFLTNALGHVFGAKDGKENAVTAGVNAVTNLGDVEVSGIGAMYGYGTATHTERDGAGDAIVNKPAQSYINDQWQRPIYDQFGKAGTAVIASKWYNNRSARLFDKAQAAEAAGKTGKADRLLSDAVKYEDKAKAYSEKMDNANGYAIHGLAKNGVKAGVATVISAGIGALTSKGLQALGIEEEYADQIGNIGTVATSGAITASAIRGATTGKATLIDKIVDGLETLVNKFADKLKGKNAVKGVKFTEQMFSKIDDFFDNFLKKIPLVKTLMSKMDDLMEKIALRLGFDNAKQAAAAVTAGIAIAVSALNGLLNGLCSVEHMFGVLPNRATPLMTTISATMKTIFGALEAIPVVGTIISILDILDTIIASIFGKGFTQLIAEFLLGLFGEGEKLKAEQEAFQSELAYYNEKYGTNLNTSTFNDKINDTAWYETLWNGKQNYDENGHLRFDDAGGNISHGLQQLFVGGERQYYKDATGKVLTDINGNAMQTVDAHGNVIKKDMKWGDHVGNWFKNTFIGGDIYKTDENGIAMLDEDNNLIVEGHKDGFFTKFTDFFKNFGGKIYDAFQNVKTGFEVITGRFKKTFDKISTGNVKELWPDDEALDPEKDGPLAGVFNVIDSIAKLLATVPTAIYGVGKLIGETTRKIFNGIKQSYNNIKTNTSQIFSKISSGDVDALWNTNTNISADTPLSGVFSALSFITKGIATVPTAIAGVGKSISNLVKKIFKPIPEAFNSTIDNVSGMMEKIKDGNISELLKIEDNNFEDNPLNGITGAINVVGKVIFTIPAAIFLVGNKIKNFFANIGTTISDGFSIIQDNADIIKEKSFKGQISELWKIPYEENENNPVGGIMKSIFIIQKVIHTPIAAIFWAGSKIAGFFTSISDSIKSDQSTYESAINNINNAGSNGDVSKIWNTSHKFNSVVGPFFSVGIVAVKLVNSIKAILTSLPDTVQKVLATFGFKIDSDSTGSTSGNNGSTYGGSAGRARGGDNGTGGETGNEFYAASLYRNATTGGNPISKTPYITSEYGPRTYPMSGFHHGVDLVAADGDSSNVTVGSRYSGTIEKVISNVPDSVRAKKINGTWTFPYQGKYPEGGNQVWIRTPDGLLIKNLHLAANSIPANIKEGSRVNIGDKIGIMGTTGWSTGNHLHYEIRKDGNSIDPTDNVMNGTTLSSFNDKSNGNTLSAVNEIMTSDNWFTVLLAKLGEVGMKFINSITGGLLGSTDSSTLSSVNDTESIEYNGNLGPEAIHIWNYLKGKGWTDEAVSAVLGCWTCESGVKAKTIEYDYCKSSEYPTTSSDGKFPYDEVISSNKLMDDWCRYLFDMYDKNGISIDRSGYEASDGHYYPGIGYAGWTGENAKKMLEYAKGKNMKWYDPALQLDWMEYQLRTWDRFINRNTYNHLQKASSPEEAATIFANDFEGCPVNWQPKRLGYARAIYNQYRGKSSISNPNYSYNSSPHSDFFSNIKGHINNNFADYAKYIGISSDNANSYINLFDSTIANPQEYIKWYAQRKYIEDVNTRYGGTAATEYLKSDASKKKEADYIADVYAQYNAFKAVGGDSSNYGKGGYSDTKNKIHRGFNGAIDYTTETWLSGRKDVQGGKGGTSDINPGMFTSAAKAFTNRFNSKGGSATRAYYGLGRGGNDIIEHPVRGYNVNLDEVITLLGHMLTELKSIASSNDSSSAYLAELNQKDFVDQGLRDSINSLGKITKKSSGPVKSSGGSARTVASLARPI